MQASLFRWLSVAIFLVFCLLGSRAAPSWPVSARNSKIRNTDVNSFSKSFMSPQLVAKNENNAVKFVDRLKRAAPLLRHSGRWLVCGVLSALIMRMLSIIELSGQGVYPSLIKLPSQMIASTLLVLDVVALIATIIKPRSTKIFGKGVIVVNVFREATELITNLCALLVLAWQNRRAESEVLIGMIIGNLFWSTLLQSLACSRWVSQPVTILNTNSPDYKEFMHESLGATNLS